MNKVISFCVLCALCVAGCANAVKVPVKVGKAVLPSIVVPVGKTVVKVGANAVKETVVLPVKIVKDSVSKKEKKQNKKDKK